MSVGFLDLIAEGRAIGWATTDSVEPVTVELLASNDVIGRGIADMFREDLSLAGIKDGRCGYSIAIPSQYMAYPISARIKETGHVLHNNVDTARRRFTHSYINSTFKGVPTTPVDCTQRKVDEFDVEIAREIIDYSRSMPDYESTPGAIWDLHVKRSQANFASMLRAGNPSSLAAYLVHLPSQPEADGFLQGESAYLALRATDSNGRSVAESPAKDALVSLAQYLGIMHVESVEVGPFGDAMLERPQTIVENIEACLGIPIVPPQAFDGLYGILTDRGVLNRRAIQGLYAAHRLKSVSGPHFDRLCEIGGGIGFAAYYAMLLGAKQVSIVDLPNMCFFQYFHLRRALPDKRVVIATTAQHAEHIEEADVTLIPASRFGQISERKRFDAVLNCDSFPEMGEAICKDYFERIRRCTELMLSINQEAACPLTRNAAGPRQTVVNEMLRDDPHYRLAYRMRSWVRHGFVEELYEVQSEDDRAPATHGARNADLISMPLRGDPIVSGGELIPAG